MNWWMPFWDQLPLFLVLSPLMGCVVTSLAGLTARDFIRHLAVANCLCTVCILVGNACLYESELQADRAARHPVKQDISEYGSLEGAQAMVHRRTDRKHADLLKDRLFVIDGINLWPVLVLTILTSIIVWNASSLIGNSVWVTPVALLFESAACAALAANHLILYVLSYSLAVLVMAALLGFWGGFERRTISEQFLVSQFSGGSLVVLGITLLATVIPWMSIEDTSGVPSIIWKISSISYAIQKWVTGNELAYQYEDQAFPWMLVILSIGFAIQYGLFPFQSFQIQVIRHAPRGIVALFLSGLLMAVGIGWWRCVMQIAPDILVELDWLILIPAGLGALWTSVRLFSFNEPRHKSAFIFASVSAISLFGCYSFTRYGMCGAWLMQQQLCVTMCVAMLAIDSPTTEGSIGSSSISTLRSGYSTRALLLMLGIPACGLFASGFLIISELFRESWLLLLSMLVAGFLICAAVYSLLIRHVTDQSIDRQNQKWPEWSVLTVMLLAIFANLFPNWMLHQCEPEFARTFRRFERMVPAASAEPDSNERQTSP